MKALGHSDAQTAMKYQHPGLERIRMAVDERNREHAELARFQAFSLSLAWDERIHLEPIRRAMRERIREGRFAS